MWRQIRHQNPNGECIHDMQRKGGIFSLSLNKPTYWYYKAFHNSLSPSVPGGPKSHRAFSCGSFLTRISTRQGKFVLGKCRSGFGPGELHSSTIFLIKLAPVLCVVREFQQLKANVFLGLWSTGVWFWLLKLTSETDYFRLCIARLLREVLLALLLPASLKPHESLQRLRDKWALVDVVSWVLLTPVRDFAHRNLIKTPCNIEHGELFLQCSSACTMPICSPF